MNAGRPSKLTAAVRKKLASALAAGNTRPDACRLAGVGLTTFKTWLARGKEEKAGEYRDFRAAVLAAETRAADHAVRAVKKAMSKHWQAATWWLERRRPREFGRKDRVEVSGRKGKPIQQQVAHDVSALIPYRAALAEFTRSILAGPGGGPAPGDSSGEPLDSPPADPQAGRLPPS